MFFLLCFCIKMESSFLAKDAIIRLYAFIEFLAIENEIYDRLSGIKLCLKWIS